MLESKFLNLNWKIDAVADYKGGVDKMKIEGNVQV